MLARALAIAAAFLTAHAGILLAQQSPTVREYVMLNHGRSAGEMTVVEHADSAFVRFYSQDRNRIVRHRTTYRFDENGSIVALDRTDEGTRAVSARAAEQFRRENGIARWATQIDSGSVRAPDAVYETRAPTPYDVALLAATLLRRPTRSAPVLPGGTARVAIVADTTMIVNQTPQRLRLAVIVNDAAFPAHSAVWLDERGVLFASQAGWLVMVRKGGEATLSVLRALETAFALSLNDSIARRFPRNRSKALAIRNASVFDSERAVVMPAQTVVVQDDRVVAVGPVGSVRIPRGATVIDGTGKTVVPGLWDMHTHQGGSMLGRAANSLLRLAAGITTMRDLVADLDIISHMRERTASGRLLAPRILPAGFIEGSGLRAGPSDAIINSEAEGLRWVAKYDSMGYRQIKLYNLIHPYWVAPIAAEAHRRGMRVSGHLPVGLSLPAAIAAGLDEINHAPFLLTTFFPDSMILPEPRSMNEVFNAVGANVAVDAPQFTAMIALLRARGTVIDGTFNLTEDRTIPLPDGSDAVFGPTLAWQPPLMRRANTPLPRSPQYVEVAQRRSANMRRLLKRLFDGGVTLVAGTDNVAGLTFHGELEIYQRAGIPAANVLQIATLNAARVMGEERNYGSVVAGKVADLVIVNGRPDLDVRRLRCTEYVVTGGRVLRSADLYRAVGLEPGSCAD